MAELKIMSFNVQGLGGIKNRKMFLITCKIRILTFYVCKTLILQQTKKYISETDGKETVFSVRLLNPMLEG